MGKRAELRRKEKAEKKAKTATYNLTQAQLDEMIRAGMEKEIKKAKEEATEEAINQALALMLILPLEVLMDYYWQKSYATRIPVFVTRVLEYYSKWENGEFDMEELKKDLWEYGRVKFVYEEVE